MTAQFTAEEIITKREEKSAVRRTIDEAGAIVDSAANFVKKGAAAVATAYPVVTKLISVGQEMMATVESEMAMEGLDLFMLGLSKPNIRGKNSSTAVVNSNRFMATTDGLDWSAVMGIHNGQKVVPMPEETGGAEDDMDIQKICKRPGLLGFVTWLKSSPAGVRMASWMASPAVCPLEATNYLNSPIVMWLS